MNIYLVIAIIIVIGLILLKIALNIKIKDIKEIKETGYDEKLNKITDKLPENIEICKKILKILNNNNVKIEEDKESKKSLYLVMKNKILIANIKDTFTRIQTIAHECIHSIQNKKILKSNFIISNINIIYFLTICILAILKIIPMQIENILFIILATMQFIEFIIRSFLEIEAMEKARYIAKEYLNEEKILTKEEENTILQNYDRINKTGIKMYNYMLVLNVAIKIIIYDMILLFTVK